MNFRTQGWPYDGDTTPGCGLVVRQAAFQNRCNNTMAQIAEEEPSMLASCPAHKVIQITVELRKRESA